MTLDHHSHTSPRREILPLYAIVLRGEEGIAQLSHANLCGVQYPSLKSYVGYILATL